MSNPVPAREYVNRNFEQVLILEDQFYPICGEIWKTIYTQWSSYILFVRIWLCVS